jgi:hypothetical protein
VKAAEEKQKKTRSRKQETRRRKRRKKGVCGDQILAEQRSRAPPPVKDEKMLIEALCWIDGQVRKPLKGSGKEFSRRNKGLFPEKYFFQITRDMR